MLKSFLRGHWGLCNTYWLVALFQLLKKIVCDFFEIVVLKPKITSVVYFVFLMLLIPGIIAVWNSARRYKGRGLWAVLAQAEMIFLSIEIAIKVVSYARLFWNGL